MSLIMWMVARNLPLYRWKEHEAQEGGICPTGYKKDDQVARIIIAGLSHPLVVELLAREWEVIPSLVRARITQTANEARGNAHRSNNVSKGIKRLDDLLRGKVLSRTDQRETTRDLRVIGGKLVSTQRRVNPAVAGAQRAFAGLVLPAHYAKLSGKEKRKLRHELANRRRAERHA